MARAPSVAGTIDVRSSSILMDYVHSHEPCAPGAAAAHARKRMHQKHLVRNRANGAGTGKPGWYLSPSPCGCAESGTPYNGSGSIYRGYYFQNRCTDSNNKRSYDRYNSGGCRGGYGGGGGSNYGERDLYGKYSGQSSYGAYNSFRSYGFGGLRGSFSYRESGRSDFSGQKQGRSPLVDLDDNFGPEEEDEEDYSNFDRTKDWLTCAGAVVIIACVVGLLHSYAVFAPAIQHHYETGLLETILVGALTYSMFIILLPVSAKINEFLEHRWTAILGMLLFFLGVLFDALTIHYSMLYVSHLVCMSTGGSLAYAASMSICSDHFRRHLGYALCAVTISGSLGTIIFYLLTNLMLSYISYMWTKICLCLLLLICMGACQTFPVRSRQLPWYTDTDKGEVKECLSKYAKERDVKIEQKFGETEVPRKSFLCVCVCDISIWTDYSFLLWAVISMMAVLTTFIPYLFLVSYAYSVGADYAVGLVCWFCLASILARLACMNSNDHTFGFNRTLFQICCFASGILYIFLNWAETYGWILVWGLANGAVEGTLCTVIPRVTLQTIPLKWVGSSWSWIIVFHSFGIFIGPMLMMSVYYTTLEFGPALIVIGAAQIIAGILAFLLPNEEFEDEKEKEESESGDYDGGRIGIDSYLKKHPFSDIGYLSASSKISGATYGLGSGRAVYGYNDNYGLSTGYRTGQPLPGGCRDFVGEINSYLDSFNQRYQQK